jgi:hypothetical protein
MLECKLHKDQHPRHAVEVRENLVPSTVFFLFVLVNFCLDPVDMSHHNTMDQNPPRSTLFLHEDVLARNLAYEQDLQAWRISELEAGRPDPGRPTYNEVSGSLNFPGVMSH